MPGEGLMPRMPSSLSSSALPRSFGPDQVFLEGNRVVIHAAGKFSDWTVREFCRPPIFFEGRKYFLLTKTDAPPPFAIGYELALWPEHEHQESNQSFSYDLQSIAERDRGARIDRKESLLHHLLVPLSPFLGFGWSRFKERTLMTLGFNPRSLTTLSLMLSFALILLEGIFVGWLRGGFLGLVITPGLLWLDWVILLALLIDAPIRLNQVMRYEDYPDGFFEWLLIRK